MKRHTLTAEEVASYLGVSLDTVNTMVKLKKLPHLEVGNDILFTKESIDLWIEDQEFMGLQIDTDSHIHS